MMANNVNGDGTGMDRSELEKQLRWEQHALHLWTLQSIACFGRGETKNAERNRIRMEKTTMFNEHMLAKGNWELQNEKLQNSILEVGDAYGSPIFPAPEPLIPTDAGVTISETFILNTPKPRVPNMSSYEEADTFIVQPLSTRGPHTETMGAKMVEPNPIALNPAIAPNAEGEADHVNSPMYSLVTVENYVPLEDGEVWVGLEASPTVVRDQWKNMTLRRKRITSRRKKSQWRMNPKRGRPRWSYQ